MEIDGIARGLDIAEPELRGGQREAQSVTQEDQAWPGVASHRELSAGMGGSPCKRCQGSFIQGVIMVGIP